MTNNKDKAIDDYFVSTHRLGRISTIIAIISFLAVPMTVTILWGIKLDMPKTITAFIAVFSIFGIGGFTEWISYTPVLGAGGTYISFITGNISNSKLPAALSSISLAGAEPGSKEGEVISTIAISVSSIVTTLILFVGMYLLTFILPLFDNPILKPAFDNLMPAILGALATPYFISSYKTASLPCVIAMILTITLGYTTVAGLTSMLTPVFLVIAFGWTYFLSKLDKKKNDAEQKTA